MLIIYSRDIITLFINRTFDLCIYLPLFTLNVCTYIIVVFNCGSFRIALLFNDKYVL